MHIKPPGIPQQIEHQPDLHTFIGDTPQQPEPSDLELSEASFSGGPRLTANSVAQQMAITAKSTQATRPTSDCATGRTGELGYTEATMATWLAGYRNSPRSALTFPSLAAVTFPCRNQCVADQLNALKKPRIRLNAWTVDTAAGRSCPTAHAVPAAPPAPASATMFDTRAKRGHFTVPGACSPGRCQPRHLRQHRLTRSNAASIIAGSSSRWRSESLLYLPERPAQHRCPEMLIHHELHRSATSCQDYQGVHIAGHGSPR